MVWLTRSRTPSRTSSARSSSNCASCAFDYEFPKKLLSKTGFIKGLVLSVYGRDLFCWSDFPGWDPEGAFMRGSSVVPGFEIAQMPGTRAIGGSIKITF